MTTHARPEKELHTLIGNANGYVMTGHACLLALQANWHRYTIVPLWAGPRANIQAYPHHDGITTPFDHLPQSCDVNGIHSITPNIHAMSCVTDCPKQVPGPIVLFAH